jgi:5'(3')-deoxyribonucleotidase
MDNTICDIKTPYLQALIDNPGIKYPQSVHNFFRELEPIAGAIPIIEALTTKGHDISFLTRPSTMNRLCYTEKADWIYKYYGQWGVDRLYFAPDKSRIIGDILIDDTLWKGFMGKQLLFGNSIFPDWNSIYQWFVMND